MLKHRQGCVYLQILEYTMHTHTHTRTWKHTRWHRVLQTEDEDNSDEDPMTSVHWQQLVSRQWTWTVNTAKLLLHRQRTAGEIIYTFTTATSFPPTAWCSCHWQNLSRPPPGHSVKHRIHGLGHLGVSNTALIYSNISEHTNTPTSLRHHQTPDAPSPSAAAAGAGWLTPTVVYKHVTRLLGVSHSTTEVECTDIKEVISTVF